MYRSGTPMPPWLPDPPDVSVTTTDSSRTTISAIAAEAGVSVPTVSKVLNGRPDVATATRRRVEEAIERHGYRPRRPRGAGASRLVDLAFHALGSPWAMEIIRGVEQEAGAARAGVVLSELGGRHRPPEKWVEDVLARRPLGVLLVLAEVSAEQRQRLAARDIPCVLVDTVGEAPDGVPAVGSANWTGALAATRHLVVLGHRHIGVITGPRDVLCSRARVDGVRSALDEAGAHLDPALVRYGNFTVRGGHLHGLDLLDRPDRPTAIFAGSDLQALGVLRVCHELGLRVPEDVSVVGYDDLPVAAWTGPSLTTVRQPLREMAATATRMALTLARGDRPQHLQVDLATELVVRESTAPPTR